MARTRATRPATTSREAFDGNTLTDFEFTPRTEYKSVELPTTTRDRNRSDIYILRVTDESIPDADKSIVPDGTARGWPPARPRGRRGARRAMVA